MQSLKTTVTRIMNTDNIRKRLVMLFPQPVASNRSHPGNFRGVVTGYHVLLASGDSILIGRSADADIKVKDGAISSRHARVGLDSDDKFYIEDMKSLNGTYLNGIRTSSSCFDVRDFARLGHTVLCFQDTIRKRAEEFLFRELYNSNNVIFITLSKVS